MAAAFDLQHALAGHLQTDRQAVGVVATDAAVAFDKARVVGDALAVQGQVGFAFHAPDHFAHGRAGLDGRWQASFVDIGQHHPAAVEGFKNHFVRLFTDLAQAPVAEEAHTGVQVFNAIGDFIDTEHTHELASTPAQASGCSFIPQ
ncbi:hypothetical protein D3C81_1425670 [compost metagenome]